MPTTYWFTDEQLQKIIDRIEPQDSGCWWYPAKPGYKGYATTRIGWPVTKSISIHRLSWMYYKGDIPEGMVIDHLCHNPAECEGGDTCLHRRCVNPEHLALVTESENNAKTVRVLKYRTHCLKGHPLENNVIEFPSRKGQYCLTCKRESGKLNARKRRAKVTV